MELEVALLPLLESSWAEHMEEVLMEQMLLYLKKLKIKLYIKTIKVTAIHFTLSKLFVKNFVH